MISTVFDELERLSAAYTQKVILARENGAPEDSEIMKSLLLTARAFRQEYQALQQQARELHARFNF